MADSNSFVAKPNNEDFFIIPCINRECSSIGFDLSSEIYKMYRNHQTETTIITLANCQYFRRFRIFSLLAEYKI